MNSSELRELIPEELRHRLEDLQEESFNLSFQHVSAQLSSPIRLRQVRREIARIYTILREHELNNLGLPGGNR